MSISNLDGVDSTNAVVAQLRDPSVKMDQLVQYTQGSNPLIPSYLALAEIQRRQDLNMLTPGQSSPTTVAQDLVSKALTPQMPMQGMTPQTAPQQAPQGVAGLQAPQGVAALPSGMGPQSFAGGGIVAFSGDKPESSDVKDPDADTSDNAYLNRSRGLVEGVKSIGNAFTNLRNYDPLQKGSDLISGAVNSVQDWGQTPLDKQAATFRSYSMTPDQTPPVGGQTVLPAAAKPTSNSGFYNDAEYSGPQVGAKSSAGAKTGAGADTGAKAGTKASDAANQLNIPQSTSASDIFGKYQQMYDEQKAQAGADKEQAKWMRLLEAGLGIMGGTSPYAAVNIGQGATGAVKGYAQDVAGMRKEQADANKELALIGMKQAEIKNEADKTGITKQHYEDWARLEQQKNGILATNAANNSAATKIALAQQGNAQKIYSGLLKADPMHMQTTDEQKWATARARAGAGESGGDTGGTTTLQWGDLTQKKS